MISTNVARLFFQQIRRAEGRRERIPSPVIGKVVDNKDPEKLGRVKVSFPSLPNEDTSWWAPIASLGAGKDRGWFFLPEIEDEVLVMFSHGDMRRPVVVGALWNGKDNSPEQNGGSNERRVLVSREGSKIEFDDDQGLVTIADGSGIGKIVLSTENKITLEASSGDVCIQAPSGELNIVADKLDINGQQNLTISSTSGMDAGSDADLNIKAGAMLQLSGQTVEANPASVNGPEEGQAECEEVPDPLTE